MAKRFGLHPYTVVFYCDAERAMETFVEYVRAVDSSEAFKKAVAKARRDGGTSSGYSLTSDDWRNASEIITLPGHHEAARK